LGSAGVSPAAFGVPPNALHLRHRRIRRGSGRHRLPCAQNH
jgi:hypothetical protein